jgi:hypothetical protein
MTHTVTSLPLAVMFTLTATSPNIGGDAIATQESGTSSQ